MQKRTTIKHFYVSNKLLAFLAVFIVSIVVFISYIIQKKGESTNNMENLFMVIAICSIAMMAYLLYRLNDGYQLLKKAELKTALSEEKYRNIIDNVASVVFTADHKGNFSYISIRAFQLTGYSVTEIVGQKFSFLIDPEWQESVANNYFQQWMDKVSETVYEFPIITKGGNRKWVEQCAVLILENQQPIGFHCIVRDITDKKMIQSELEESETKLRLQQNQLQSILDHTTSIIYIKDIEGNYVLANKRFLEVLQVTKEQVIGQNDYFFSSKEHADLFSKLDALVLSERKPIEIEHVIEGKNGSINLLLIKFPLFDQNNKIFGISGIATDISERTQYQKDLIAARQTAENAKQLQEQFLANMSHEIRTPMNGIQGMTNLLLETVLEPQQKKYATIIKRSVNNLLVVINDILDFSKIQAGKLTIENIGFNFRETILALEPMFAHRLNKKQIKLEFNIDQNIPTFLSGDPYRLNQILVNLLGNAIKFTEVGSIEIVVQVLKQDINGVLLKFSVTDTGIGIPAHKLNTIFESFAQAGSDVARKYGGTGLGLSISKQLVEIQKGSIYVDSIEGKGAEFIFEIPYQYAGADEVSNFKRLQDVDFTKLLTGKKVLIAEDNYVNQVLIEHVLQKIGMVTTIVNNGNEVIAKLTSKPEFDLILMDLQMPLMDGYQTTTKIRQQMKIDIPIVAMTATAMKGELEKCIEVGMTDYMSKPYEFVDLYKKICNVLSIRFNSIEKVLEKKSVVEILDEKPYDLSYLLRIIQNDELIKILQPLIQNMHTETSIMEACIQNNNWIGLKKVTHKLKGTVSLLKAHELLNSLQMVENAIMRENTAIAHSEMVKINKCSFEITKQLKQEYEQLNNKNSVA